MARGKYRGGKATGRRTFTSPEELEAEQRAQRGGAGGRGGGGDSGRGGDGSRRAAAGELPSDSDDDDNDVPSVKGKEPAEPAEAPRAPPVQRQQHRAFEVGHTPHTRDGSRSCPSRSRDRAGTCPCACSLHPRTRSVGLQPPRRTTVGKGLLGRMGTETRAADGGILLLFQDGQGERPALSRKEREELEKQQAQARYWKLHEQVKPLESPLHAWVHCRPLSPRLGRVFLTRQGFSPTA